MNADGSAATNLTPATALNDAPSWSPDSSKIAFSSKRAGSWEIYVMGADGSSPTRLTHNARADDAFPDWSPDGTKIAFNTDREGNYEIYVMNADGSGQANLSRSATTEDFQPSWSPDGTKVLFSSEGAIEVINADGTGLTNLTPGNADNDAPAWSPDGTRIAFSSKRDGDWDIYVMGANGTAPTRLTNNNAPDDAFPEWSPDGTKIVFNSDRDGHYKIYVMNADGSGQQKLTTDGRRDDFDPNWSPNGTRIAFSDIDLRGPKVSVRAASRQAVLRTRSVKVKVACNERCSLNVSGQIAAGAARIALRGATGKSSGKATKFSLRLSPAKARKLALLLAQGKHPRATIVARAFDRSGNEGGARKRISVRG